MIRVGSREQRGERKNCGKDPGKRRRTGKTDSTGDGRGGEKPSETFQNSRGNGQEKPSNIGPGKDVT